MLEKEEHANLKEKCSLCWRKACFCSSYGNSAVPSSVYSVWRLFHPVEGSSEALLHQTLLFQLHRLPQTLPRSQLFLFSLLFFIFIQLPTHCNFCTGLPLGELISKQPLILSNSSPPALPHPNPEQEYGQGYLNQTSTFLFISPHIRHKTWLFSLFLPGLSSLPLFNLKKERKKRSMQLILLLLSSAIYKSPVQEILS